MLQFDDVLEYLGEFGLYQKRAYFLLCLVYTLPASHAFAQVFLAAETDHWCYIPELEKYGEDCNVSNTVMFCQDMMKNHSIPSMESSSQCGSGLVYSNCERYENLSYSNDTMKCNHGWRYDRSQYKSTVFQEFDLVCNRYFLAALSSSMFQLGLLVGGVIFGALSDKIGRMPSMMLAVLCMLVAGTACAFSPNIIVYSICRLIIGCGVIGVWLIAFVLATEYVGPSKRVIAGMVVSSFTSIGCTILAVFAYFIRYWWILQLCISIPTAIFLSFWWLIPESPRWLLSVGKYNRANKIIKVCAEVNKVTVPDSMYEEMSKDVDDPKPENKEEMGNALDLFRLPNMRRKTLNIFYNWFTAAMVYYGLSLNTSNLGGNDYLNAFLAGAVEVPAYILAIFLPETRLGRRWSQSSTLILGGVACVLTLFTPSCKLEWIGITLAMIGKFAITAAFGIIYIFSAEIYPTPIRTIGMGLSSLCGRIGGILAPQMILIKALWEPLPLIIFGSTSIVAGLLTLLLPETRHHKLPETLQDGEMFGKNKQSFGRLNTDSTADTTCGVMMNTIDSNLKSDDTVNERKMKTSQ